MQQVELFELPQPARGVALDDDALVIDHRVAVWLPVAQHREDATCELVRCGHGGALVAAATHGQRLVIALELAVLGACGAVGALDQRRANRGVAGAGAGVAAFAGASLTPIW